MNKTGSPIDSTETESSETGSKAASAGSQELEQSLDSPKKSRRWMSLIVLGVCAVAAYFVFQALTAGDAVETTNNDIKFEAIDSTVPAADQPTAIVKGGITDLLNDHPVAEAENPLDPLLMVAEEGLKYLRANLVDYTAIIERQERVDGQLMPTETIGLKIRQAQEGDPGVARGIYTLYHSPKDKKGQEAIWVEGENDGNLVAHTTGLLNFKRFYLPTEGFIAMRGSRYPITEAGFEVLIERMLERGRRDREYGSCEVKVDRNATINGRSCTAFEIIHDKQEGPYDFHIARIFIDDELNLPIHYEAHIWPEEEGGEPQLLERYTYTDIKINPGLTESDFDPSNPDYAFPSR